ncbi:MAG: serine/threonine protein kinase [Myxococcales bacterium]|nr:serine/threonine protein kinase [Myxococcales bacterium]
MKDTLQSPPCPRCGAPHAAGECPTRTPARGSAGGATAPAQTAGPGASRAGATGEGLGDTLPSLPRATARPDARASGSGLASLPAEARREEVTLDSRSSLLDDRAERRIGQVIGGRYRIEAVIGTGGFGSVYRARQLSIDEPVAIKFLRSELARHSDLRARLRREAKALARLRHPNIVSVLDFDDRDDDPYIVMELVDGATLESQLVVDGKLLSLARLGVIFDQLLGALATAHAAEVVHRDLKPDNVLLLRDGGRVKVLDFGIALMREREDDVRLTATGAVQGTPLYMAPEQCRGRDVDAKADIYAVGGMLFAALTGVPPFTGDSGPELMMKHMFVEPPPLQECGQRPAVSPALEALVRRALAKRPELRPTAVELRDKLAQTLTGDDSVTFALRGQAERQRGPSREERALPERPAALTGEPAMADDECVLLWGVEAPRAERLIAAMAANGLWGVRASQGPDGPVGRRVRALVIGPEEVATRIAGLRSRPTTAKLPVLVIDVVDVAATPGLVRAGASDVGLAQVGDEALCAKLRRMIRRGR